MAATRPSASTASLAAALLFGGYALVAMVAAWLAGVAFYSIAPLAPPLWLAVAACCAVFWAGAGLAARLLPTRSARGWLRLPLVAGMLGLWLCLGAARAACADPTRDPNAISHVAQRETVRVQGLVATEPDLRAGYRLLTVDVSQVSRDGGATWRPASGAVEAKVVGPDDWFAPDYGDVVSLNGTLDPPDSATPAGVLARLTNARATIVSRGGGNPLLAWLFDLRVGLAQAIQHGLPEPEASLLIGILLGMKTPTLRARLPLFTATGTIHLVVPAGLKVSTLAELATYAARPLGRWPRTGAALGAVGVYAALGGGGPAAIRAAIMGALLALAPALGRAYNVYTALALAAFVMTAIEPAVLYDAGFQLTVLATFGLPLLVPPIQRRIAAGLRWLPVGGVVGELLAVTVAAQVATLPVLALTFHQVSLVAPVANLLTVPLLAPTLILGSLLALAGLFTSVAAGVAALALAWVLWPLLWFMDAVIAICAALPAAAFPVANMPAVFAFVYYAALAGVVWWLVPLLRRRRTAAGNASQASVSLPAHAAHASRHVRLSRGLLAALLVFALLGSCGAAAPALAAQTARLVFLGIGPGGAAILVRLATGVTALIDGGPSGPALETALAGALPFWQRSLDLALLTDPRPGDARGLEDLAGHFTLARAADAGMAHPNTEYLAWLDTARRAGASHSLIRQGATIALASGTALSVLAPPQTLYPPGEGDTTASDDLILRLDTPGLRALFLGAADAYALDALAYAGEPLAADVVEVALTPSEPLDLTGPLGQVLRLAHPRLVVITSAPITPTSKTAQRNATLYPWDTDAATATSLGASIYRVDAAGTLTLSGGAGGWSIG